MYKLMTDPRKFKRSGAKVKVSAEKVIAVENYTYSRTVEHQGKTYDVQTEVFTKNGEIVKYESTFTPSSICLDEYDFDHDLTIWDLTPEERVGVKSKFFGHDIHIYNDIWVFSDTLEPTETTHHSRPCGHCGFIRGEDDHDPCIKSLPYVLNACCGHGDQESAYVMLQDRECYYGEDALRLIEWLKQEKVSPQAFKPIEVSRALRSERRKRK
jgi:hypothetical protein